MPYKEHIVHRIYVCKPTNLLSCNSTPAQVHQGGKIKMSVYIGKALVQFDRRER
jgi:hypothetical protein